jgi:hypothetical protein
MNTNIQFVPQHEASFICPQSAFDSFQDFLKKEHIVILCSEEAGESNGEPFYSIEVSDVDLPESKQLISKFIASFPKTP